MTTKTTAFTTETSNGGYNDWRRMTTAFPTATATDRIKRWRQRQQR